MNLKNTLLKGSYIEVVLNYKDEEGGILQQSN